MTLYRKYRPQKFSDVAGQPQVTGVISRAVAANQPAHAYLFAGPRGTGKTSVARILAKAVNCTNRQPGEAEPCNTCDNCQAISKGAFLDVQEIDAASQTSVEGIRELTEQVAIAPALGKCKIYILDEAHMLSNSAFNALLKTLEEPPAHAIFVLCTTEAHKIPVTVASRCQRLTFVRATVPELVEQLQAVATSEKVTIEAAAIELLAVLSDGGYRDAEMLLEQVITTSKSEGVKNVKITRAGIESQLGLANQQVVSQLIGHIIDGNSPMLVGQIEQFASQGGNIRQLTDALLDQCRLLLLTSVDPALSRDAGDEEAARLAGLAKKINQARLLGITQQLLDARQKLQHYQGHHQALALETALLEVFQPATNPLEGHSPTNQSAKEPHSAQTKPVKANNSPEQESPSIAKKHLSQASQPPQEPQAQEVQNTLPKPIPEPPPVAGPPPTDLADLWAKILDAIRPQSRSVEALLRDCLPLSFDGTILVLQFWYVFHKNKLDIDKNRTLVEDAASQVAGSRVKIQTQLGNKNDRPKKKPMSQEDIHNVSGVEEENLLDAAVEIFGGEIVE